MHHQSTARLGMALLLSGTAIVTIAAVATTSTAETAYATVPTHVAACSLTVTDSAPVMKDPVLLKATLSESIGDSLTASLPVESKVSIAQVDSMAGMPNMLQLTLSTVEAVPGEYTLAVKGTKGECSGKVKVTASP